MRSMLLMLAFGGFTAVALAEDKKEPLVREIALTELTDLEGRGDVTKPIAIKTAEELEKLLGKKAAEQVKDVNFEKETLLLFHWSGSGGDKLTASNDAGQKPAVVFTITRGLTRDLRHHVKLFAISKSASWSFAK